jgi:multidrug efflux pump subunit AcrA (membrane-fusion protein)
MKKNQIKQSELDAIYAVELPELKPTTFSYNFAIFSVSFLICMTILSTFIEAPSSVELPGKLVLDNPAIPVRAARSFTVFSNNLVENQYVASGAVLITSTFGFSPQFLKLHNMLIGEIEQISNSNEDCTKCLFNLTEYSESIQKMSERSLFPEFLDFVSKSKIQIAALSKSLNGSGEELRNSFARIEEIDKRLNQKRAVASENDKQKLTTLRGQLYRHYAATKQRYTEQKAVYLQYKSAFKPQFELLKSRMAQLEAKENIRAPIDGKVTNIKVRGTGEMVPAGQILFEIVPEKSNLMVQLDVSNRDIGTIKIGDEVEVAFDAYPEYDYGRVKAKVVKILEPDSLENPNASAARSFRVQAELNSQTIRGKTQEHQLLNSLTLKARLNNRKESLFMSFLRTIFKFKDEIKS